MNLELTVKDLLEFIKVNNIPLDGIVKYQRIEDSYFEPGKGWSENSTMKPHDLYEEMGDGQYINAFTCIKYPNDKDLYITAHY